MCPHKMQLSEDDLSCVDRTTTTTSTSTESSTTSEITENPYDVIQINGRLYPGDSVHLRETTTSTTTQKPVDTNDRDDEVKSQPVASNFDTKGLVIGELKTSF